MNSTVYNRVVLGLEFRFVSFLCSMYLLLLSLIASNISDSVIFRSQRIGQYFFYAGDNSLIVLLYLVDVFGEDRAFPCKVFRSCPMASPMPLVCAYIE